MRTDDDEDPLVGVKAPTGTIRGARRARHESGIARAFTVSEKDGKSYADSRLRIEQGAAIEFDLEAERPKLRADCVDAPRPCPWVGCKHHLYLDVNPETGSIKLNYPNLEPWHLVESCTLDVGERGGLTLEQTADFANLTRERVRQIELKAFAKANASPIVVELRSA